MLGCSKAPKQSETETPLPFIVHIPQFTLAVSCMSWAIIIIIIIVTSWCAHICTTLHTACILKHRAAGCSYGVAPWSRVWMPPLPPHNSSIHAYNSHHTGDIIVPFVLSFGAFWQQCQRRERRKWRNCQQHSSFHSSDQLLYEIKDCDILYLILSYDRCWW